MVLGFKKQFEAPILQDTKIHTIREDLKDRWHTGMHMHMATGMRTKYYNCFKECDCISTQRIFMSYDWMLHVSIGLKCELYHEEKERLAMNDGFKDFKEFESWWYPVLAKRELQCYSGKIIHWTPFRY